MDDSDARPTPAPTSPGRLRVGRVVGKASTGGTRVAVPVAAAAPQGARARPRVPFAFVLAGAVVAVAVVTLILNFTLPWMRTEGNFSSDGGLFFGFGDSTLDRSDLEDGAGARSDYIDDLLDWPVLALTGLLILSPLLAVLELIPIRAALGTFLHRAAAVAGAVLGFVLALTGTRWVGLYLGEVWHVGGADFHLHVVPYLNLTAGLAVVAIFVFALWRDGRPAGFRSIDRPTRVFGASAAVAALTLLLAPLLPYATASSDFDDETEYWGEFYFDLFRDVGARDIAKPGDDLHLARLMVWIVLYASLAASLATAARSSLGLPMVWETVSHLYAPAAFLLVTGTVFSVLFYVHLPELEDAVTVGGLFTTDIAPYVNVVLPLGLLTLMVLYAFYVRDVLAPFMRRLSTFAPPPAPERPPQAPAPPTFERR